MNGLHKDIRYRGDHREVDVGEYFCSTIRLIEDNASCTAEVKAQQNCGTVIDER